MSDSAPEGAPDQDQGSGFEPVPESEPPQDAPSTSQEQWTLIADPWTSHADTLGHRAFVTDTGEGLLVGARPQEGSGCDALVDDLDRWPLAATVLGAPVDAVRVLAPEQVVTSAQALYESLRGLLGLGAWEALSENERADFAAAVQTAAVGAPPASARPPAYRRPGAAGSDHDLS